MKRFTALLLAIFIVLSMAACSEPAESSAPVSPSAESSVNVDTPNSDPKDLSLDYVTMYSGTQGASWFSIGSAMMEYFASDYNVLTTNGPGASAVNGQALQSGEAQLGWMSTAYLADAQGGVNTFEDFGVQDKLCHVMSLFEMQFQCLVPASSDIQTIGDAYNRVINFMPTTEGAHFLFCDILEEYGITMDSVLKNGGAVVQVRFNEAAELIKNNQLDMFGALLSTPASAVSEIAYNPGVRFMNIDGAERDAILEKLQGYVATTIPAGSYEGQTEDVQTIGALTNIVASTDVPDDVVYAYLECMYNHWDEIVAVNPSVMGGIEPADWLNGYPGELHPGAEQWYKDHGLL